ncbi:MAG TPA: hypothetical protein VFA18_10550, partial [Gemmataceae bacterium]|nr:hypothetical protein [Gemmataceae bacterium]
SWDGTACLWDPMTGRQLLSTRLAGDLRFSPDDTQLAHLHSYRPAVWQVARSSACRRLYWHGAGTFSGAWVDFSPDGRLLASGSRSGVRLWDTRTGRLLGRLRIGGVFSVVFGADGRSLLTSGAAGLLRWPMQQLHQGGGEGIRLGPPQFVRTGGFEHVAWNRRGQRVALAERSARAFLLDLDRPAGTARGCEHMGLASCEMSADGKWVATGNFKGSDVRIWDAATGRLVRKLAFPSHTGAVFSPDSRTLLTTTGNEYRFWTVGTWVPGAVIQPENRDSGGGNAAFSPDGRMLAVIHAFATVKVFDARTQQELATLHAPGSRNIGDLCWSPDGSQLAAATASQVIQLWDLRGIRRRLAAEGLDWEPPLPPEPKALPPVQVQVDLGDTASRLRLAEADDPSFAVRFNSIVLAFSPFNGAAYLRRAVALAAQHKDAQARADAVHALQLLPPGNGPWLEPQHALLFNDLAWWSISGRPPRLDAAAAVLLAQRALAIAPDEYMYQNTLGVACYRLGRYPEAVAALERSLHEGKGRADAFDLFFLAMCHHQLGRPAQARACYNRAVRWVAAHRTHLPASWATELLAFREEAAALLHIPDPAAAHSSSGH